MKLVAKKKCCGWDGHPCERSAWFIPKSPRQRRCPDCAIGHAREYERLRPDKAAEPCGVREDGTATVFPKSVLAARRVAPELTNPKAIDAFITGLINYAT